MIALDALKPPPRIGARPVPEVEVVQRRARTSPLLERGPAPKGVIRKATPPALKEAQDRPVVVAPRVPAPKALAPTVRATQVRPRPTKAKARPPKAQGAVPRPLVAPPKDAGPMPIAGQPDARKGVTPRGAITAAISEAKTKVGRYPSAVRVQPPLAAAAVMEVPVAVWPRVAVAPPPTMVLLKEVIIARLATRLVALALRQGVRAGQGRPLIVAPAPLEDQEAAQLRPPLVPTHGPPPQVVPQVGRPIFTPRPKGATERRAAALNMGHAGRPLRVLKGPPEEAMRKEAQIARHEEIADRVKVTVKAGDGPLNVPLAPTPDPIALLLAPPPGRALPVARRATVVAPAMAPTRKVPVEEPPGVGLIIQVLGEAGRAAPRPALGVVGLRVAPPVAGPPHEAPGARAEINGEQDVVRVGPEVPPRRRAARARA